MGTAAPLALAGEGPAFDIETGLSYLKQADLEQVRAAFEFSCEAHSGQFRVSGEAYISHPLAVAGILARWHLDAQAIMAALKFTPSTTPDAGMFC